jgi:hypothetical protein
MYFDSTDPSTKTRKASSTAAQKATKEEKQMAAFAYMTRGAFLPLMEHQEKVHVTTKLREAQKYSDYLRTEISKVNKLIAKNGDWNEADDIDKKSLEDFTLRLDDNKAHLKKLRDSMMK